LSVGVADHNYYIVSHVIYIKGGGYLAYKSMQTLHSTLTLPL